MSNLIVVIISVVLVVVMGAASVYYGGSIWNDQGKNVDAAKLANHASQMEGAIELYHSERGNYPSSMADLVTQGYLNSEVPGTWTFETDYVVTQVANEDSCLKLNQIHGIEVVPTCGDTAYEGKTYCCVE